MIVVTEVFKALSDPVRIEMVQRLSQRNSLIVGDVSSDLGVTRQGARKHLAVLEKAQLIHLYKKGRSTEVQLNTESLQLAKAFIAKLERQWDKRLLALRDFVENEVKK